MKHRSDSLPHHRLRSVCLKVYAIPSRLCHGVGVGVSGVPAGVAVTDIVGIGVSSSGPKKAGSARLGIGKPKRENQEIDGRTDR